MLAILAALLIAAPEPPPDITFDHLLALEQRAPARAPFRADPVQSTMWQANWHEPAEGDKVGENAWTTLAPKQDEYKQNYFEDKALAGGYALAAFDSPEDGVMILDAAGHSMVYVNPSPTTFEMHTGDLYEFGFVRVPIKVRKGHNSLLFAAGRGRLRAKVTASPAPVYISGADATMPDLYQGMDPTAPLDAAVVVVNATDEWQRNLVVAAFGPETEGEPVRTPIASIPPLSVRKVPVTLRAPSKPEGEEMKCEFVLGKAADSPLTTIGSGEHSVPFALRVRKEDQTRKVTFRSRIDDSVQYFGYNPPKMPEAAPGISAIRARPALILSLHGASVEAAHQAECYSPKIWAALAAPTNRREYGFDWEDWGRLDALEVLEHFGQITPHDPQQVYLTGHSMGGHGTWIIGATYPDKFAAIAPSAGWTTFWSYGGAEHFDKNQTPITRIFQRALNPGDTMALAKNTLSEGVYILHGDKDDNVPVEQARTMKTFLTELQHPDLQYHEQEGAGHWWGNQCMDWPALMDFLKSHSIPKPSEVAHLQFTTANPAVSARCHWASILQQQNQDDFSSIDLTVKTDEHNRRSRVIQGTTTNVAALAIHIAALGPDAEAVLEIDHAVLDPRPARDTIYLKRTTPVLDANGIVSQPSTWALAAAPAPTEKNPARCGPFKHAFNRRAVLVYGTKGSPEENAWMLAKARFDAETIWYRGNGCFDIVADTDFTAPGYPDRSVILYGNNNINAAWELLLKDSPLEVHRGGMFIGEHEFKDDWFAALFARPRPPGPNSPESASLVGAVAFTGLRGARALERLSYFSSGVAYPDWTVFSARTLTEGMKGVEGAGYFDNSWALDEAQSAWLTP
jgi:pimeloyl-ACP methyl ester carboxylesterase